MNEMNAQMLRNYGNTILVSQNSHRSNNLLLTRAIICEPHVGVPGTTYIKNYDTAVHGSTTASGRRQRIAGARTSHFLYIHGYMYQ